MAKSKAPASVLSQTQKWREQPVAKRVQTNPGFSPQKQAASNELIGRAYGQFQPGAKPIRQAPKSVNGKGK